MAGPGVHTRIVFFDVPYCQFARLHRVHQPVSSCLRPLSFGTTLLPFPRSFGIELDQPIVESITVYTMQRNRRPSFFITRIPALAGVTTSFFLGEKNWRRRRNPSMSTAYLKLSSTVGKHGDDRAALVVVGCIIDLLAIANFDHRELLLGIIETKNDYPPPIWFNAFVNHMRAKIRESRTRDPIARPGSNTAPNSQPAPKDRSSLGSISRFVLCSPNWI